MKKIRLIDSCFPQTTASIAGDNHWRGPEHFEWCREVTEEMADEWMLDVEAQEKCDSLYTWFTNWVLLDRGIEKYPKKVVWLLEPPSIRKWPYLLVGTNRDKFDAVLTYDKRLLDVKDNRFKFAPHGGSWIDWDLWGMHEKTKDVCMIVSDKNESEGHKLRHEIAKEFGDRIDVYGPSYQKFDRKFDVLKNYRYCVVVESVKMDYYFSEKLIDAISVGCIPIYWGCPSLDKYFDWHSNRHFSNMADLDYFLLTYATDTFYENAKMSGWLSTNLEDAKQYRMPEDWMYAHYEELFR